jgi:hypothetical protein
MRLRKRQLPGGWYPSTAGQTRSWIEERLKGIPEPPYRALSGIAPHAGWEFCGDIALEVIRSLGPNLQTVVVVGGHLPPGDGTLAATEEGYDTPLGALPADLELLEFLRGWIPPGEARRAAAGVALREDRQPDNTVEVHLSFIRFLFPAAMALGLRASPDGGAVLLGEALAEASTRLGRAIGVLGSTDLTHYGPNYRFSPQGGGAKAVDWVREVNDRRLIEALLDLDLEEALGRGQRERSACSAGGAVAAAAFARRMGAPRGRLLRYRTSSEVFPSDSFVGYAGIVYPPV